MKFSFERHRYGHLKFEGYPTYGTRSPARSDNRDWSHCAVCSPPASRRVAWPGLLPQDLVHGPALCQFVNQLVEVSDLLHELILNLLDSITANYTCYFRDVRINSWRLGEECLKI